MNPLSGVLFEGNVAAGRPVTLEPQGERVAIITDDGHVSMRRNEFVVDTPVPGVPRRLHLPGGSEIEVSDHAGVEAIWPTPGAWFRFVYAVETHWAATVGAIAAVALVGWLVIVYVLPLAAEPIANSISPAVDRALGKQALETLDSAFAKPSELAPEIREEVEDRFEALVKGEPGAGNYELAFRKMEGPNAFALPGNIIVVTDAMVEFVDSEDELMAVLAHEIGHQRSRHALRMVLQQSGVAVLVTAVAGDAVGMTILAAAIPAAVLDSHYSRQFETEADTYAFAHLKRHDISPQAFADVMRRFQKDARTADAKDPLSRYLSTHPDLDERIARAEAAAAKPPATPPEPPATGKGKDKATPRK